MLHGKSKGGMFLQPFQEIKGKISLFIVLIVALISSANYQSYILQLANIKIFNLQRKLTHFPTTTQVSATPQFDN